jgi:iron(III) transport system permease protein
LKDANIMTRRYRQAVIGIIILSLGVVFGFSLVRNNPDWLSLVLPTGRRLTLLVRSLVLCGLVALIDLTLGVLVASAFWKWSKKARWLRWLPLVMGVLPPYIQALTWNDAFSILPYRIPGELAAGWVMVMAYLPVGAGIALLSLETVSPQPVDAARIWRSDLSVFWHVLLPLAGPLLAAGGVFLFLLNVMDYSIPSLFGVNIYALEIFAEYSASSQPARALLLSVPLIVLAAALLPVLRRVVRFASQQQAWGASPWSTQPAWPRAFVLLQRFVLGLWGLQIGAPLFSLLKLSLSNVSGNDLLVPASGDLFFSFTIAAAAAVLCLPLGWAVMEGLELWQGLEWLIILPLVIPAPLIGAGIAALFNQPYLEGLYNSAWMPVLASLVRFAPLAVLTISAQKRRVDPLLFDAARVFQKNELQGAWQVRLPLLAPGLAAAACLVFALSLGELGATLIVIPPGQNTLSLRIYNYLHYGASEVVAQLCLMVMLITLAAGGSAALVLTRLGRQPNSRLKTEET